MEGIVKVWTKSGSVYTIDRNLKTIRREGAPSDEVNNMGPDRASKYDLISYSLGKRMVIVWPEGVPLANGNPSDSLRRATTLTSVIRKIEFNCPMEDMQCDSF